MKDESNCRKVSETKSLSRNDDSEFVSGAADAAHIAIAAAQGMDFLMTWNCRHIANAMTVDRVRELCARLGFPAPVICTPYELMLP
jgi:hypothetical protein